MKYALLVCVLSTAASAQLAPSSSWKYSVVSGGGSSTRVLIFLESPPESARKAREWWTVETGAADADGSIPVTLTVRNAEGSRKTNFKAERGVMVTRDAPPRVLSMERVPCTAPFLGGIGATCAGHAGGPLNQPELPLLVQVEGDTNQLGRSLAALGTFIISAGVLLPGTDDRSVVARLELSPSPLPPKLAAWRKSAHTVAALEKLKIDDDAETLGALLVLGGAPNLDVVQALVQRAPTLDRWPLIRLARQSGADARFTVRLVARLSNSLSADQRELQTSALAGFGPSETNAIGGLVAGKMPTLRGVAANAKQLDVEVAKALETAELQPGEGVALALLMSKPALEKALPRFIERLPDEEGIVIVDALVRDDSDARRLAVLQRLPKWVDRVLQGTHGADLLKTLTLDTQRTTLLQATWKHAPADAHPQLLKLGIESMTFDAGRLDVLRAWVPQTQLTLADSRAMLDLFSGDRERDQAARLLMPGVAAGERSALVTYWLSKTRDSEIRVRALKDFAPTLSLADARAVYDAASFDDDRTACTIAMLPFVAEADRAEFFVHSVTHMSFDAGRLELLKSPARPKLNDAQINRVLNAFVFEREKAATLLH